MKQKLCGLCPKNCLKNEQNSGYCGANENIAEVALIMLHKFEEPFISGQNGSGTVFFARCNLRCVYCQNYKISRAESVKTKRENSGERVERMSFNDAFADSKVPMGTKEFKQMDYKTLAHEFLSLQEKGAHNINLVTPTHYSKVIVSALKEAKEKGLNIPVIYNTGGYERAEIIKGLKDAVDIFLTDFKYFDNAYALKYSHCKDYFEHAFPALSAMVENTGAPKFDENGMLFSGVVVRHLTLPGCLADSKRILAHLYLRFGDSVFFSIMNQFTPTAGLDIVKYPELNRAVPKKQYNELVSYAVSLGIKNALIQEGGTVSESFIPEF